MTGETSRTILPSATGFAARQAIAFLRARDVPIASLLNRAGVSESDIDNRQRRIAALAQGRLLEHAAETLNDSEFGLHLAQSANPREAGLLFYVSSAAEDIKGEKRGKTATRSAAEQLRRSDRLNAAARRGKGMDSLCWAFSASIVLSASSEG